MFIIEKTLFLLIFGLIGIIFLIVGIFLFKKYKEKQLRCTFKTEGKTKDIVSRSYYTTDNTYNYKWYPVFEYTIGEQTFVKESLNGKNNKKCYKIGELVDVYYNPSDYEDYYVVGCTNRVGAIVLVLIGIWSIIMGILMFILI